MVFSITPIFYNDVKVAYLKNDYRSVITRTNITPMCHISCHNVVLLTFNKDDPCCRKYIKRWRFFEDGADTPKDGVEQHRKQECLKGVIRKRKIPSGKTQ